MGIGVCVIRFIKVWRGCMDSMGIPLFLMIIKEEFQSYEDASPVTVWGEAGS